MSSEDKCPAIYVFTDSSDRICDFEYMNIYGMYNTENKQGHRIQVNDTNLEKPLLKMCDKIAQAVYEYNKEIGILKDR